MIVIIPKVTYYKPHRLKRFRQRDENGVSMWRKFKWKGKSQKADIQQDELDPDYTTTADFLIFYP